MHQGNAQSCVLSIGAKEVVYRVQAVRAGCDIAGGVEVKRGTVGIDHFIDALSRQITSDPRAEPLAKRVLASLAPLKRGESRGEGQSRYSIDLMSAAKVGKP